MAGGTITRISLGNSSTVVEGSFEGFYENLTMNAGKENRFTAKVTNHGNPKEPEKKDGYFVKGWWTNHKDERIKRAVYGQKLRFHIQMNRERVNVGDIVKFALYDSDMRSFGNDTVKADDPILLVHTETEKPYTDEVVNAEYKVIIEFTAGYNSLANALIKDKDGIYELYFRCSYVNKGKEPQHIELPLSFGDYLNLGSIVIDRYKMPGLNPEGTGIAEDMAYGKGKPYKGKRLYDKSYVEQYIKEYTETGFDMDNHSDFANVEQKIIELEEIQITAKRKHKNHEKSKEAVEAEVWDYIDKLNEETQKENKKAIYTKEEIREIFVMRGIIDINDEELLWHKFRIMSTDLFSQNEMENNIIRMIDKMRENRGGIYEDDVLTNTIKNNPATKEYCQKVEDYIAEQLKIYFSKLEKVEDREPYFRDENKIYKNKKYRRVDIGKNDFGSPAYTWRKNWNILRGETIALNDIWATEVIFKELNFIDTENYKAKYEIILWDHFGLDKPDIELILSEYKIYSLLVGFRAWFVLQHLWGYKTFLTKITFEKEFNGHLNIGKEEREKQRIDKWVEEEKQKMWRQPKF